MTVDKTCRTFSSWDINWKDDWNNAVMSLANGEDTSVNCPMSSSHMKDGRGNIAPATIILPTLAMEAKRKAEKDDNLSYVVDYFIDILEKAIEDCKDELIERFNWICAQKAASAKFMYENNTFFSYTKDFEKEGIRGALKHGTLAIGQLGLAECLQILVGCDHTEPRGMETAKEIETLFKRKCAEYKEEWRYNPITNSDEIAIEMISNIEKKEGRKLSDEEKNEISSYCAKRLKTL